MDIHSYYCGKNILLTGCTGFLGKVILEKVLRSLPETGKIYLLVRPKKNVEPIERVREILSSYCFTRIKRKFETSSSFNDYIKDKVIPIQGDLTMDRLGISEGDR